MDKGGKKYQLLELGTKLEILETLQSNEKNGIKTNNSELGRKYNVSETTIRRIKTRRRKFYEMHLQQNDKVSRLKMKKKILNSKHSILEETLYKWFKQKIAIGQAPSKCSLAKQALLINSLIKGDKDFKASRGWVERFKNRFQIQSHWFRDNKSLTNCEDEREFVNKLESIMRLRDFQLYQIYNADETGIFVKMLPETSFDEFDKNLSKERVTVMVCANADGSHRIPLFIIGNSKDTSCLEDVHRLPFVYNSQEDGFMTRELFIKWYIEVFLPSIRKFQAESGRSYNVLLILDNATCHLSKNELDAVDDLCSVELLPPSGIFFQPMNQGIVEEIKKHYRRSFLREILLECDDNSLLKLANAMTMKTCCVKMASAWSEISDSRITHSWRKLIPTCKVDTENSVITVDEIKEILQRIPCYRNITKEQISAWLQIDRHESGWKLLSIEQILESIHGIKTEFETMSTDSVEMEFEDVPKEEYDPLDLQVEATEAYQRFQEFRDWFQKQWECGPEHVIMLEKINDITKDIISRKSI
ncbi:jerky protein homolog-like isoform X2 [Leptopilina heterotoma]|uniref:jerky protein homolog-like isoform X2 n=1 Tax=Leptopilina heterotoma TaxID=63436 RepID=UPI001CA90C9E|nr:jerky protein homolog-like isoform X2 [Leptopilina heterotoma]